MTPAKQDKPPRTRSRKKSPPADTNGAGGGAAAPSPQPQQPDAADSQEQAAPPRPPDAPPDASRRRRPTTRAGRRSKASVTKEIADGLAELLTLPAIPCAIAGDEWASEHFTTQGRKLADSIAGVSERNPKLREWCERMLEGETVAVLLMASVMYAAPPLIHWGIIPGPPGLFGAPERRTAIVPEPPEDVLDVSAHFPDGEPPAEVFG